MRRGLPLKNGRAATVTHHYKRNGTTTLFAALNILDGQVSGQCQQRHTHTEWLKFLKPIERETAKDKTLQLIADNYATHKHPAVQRWLSKRPRFHMHFALTLAPWLNMVERVFRDITTERLRRDVFTSAPELVAPLEQYIAEHNANPKPFIWTKSARDILQKTIRANVRLRSKQTEALHQVSSLAHPGHPTGQTATKEIALHGSPANRRSSGAGLLLTCWPQFAVRQRDPHRTSRSRQRSRIMNNLIWLVGAVVIVLFVLGYFGLR